MNGTPTVLGSRIKPMSSRPACRSSSAAAPDGSNWHKVNPELPVGADVSGFAWSPSASTIAYVADQDTVAVRELYVSASDGTENHKINAALPDGGFGFVTGFRWSPDGGRIAYLADQDAPGVSELYTSLADGTDNHRVNGPLQPLSAAVGLYRWSPDSTRIAYLANQDDTSLLELFTSASDGSNNRKINAPLVADGSVDIFEWSPDSLRIAYRATQRFVGVPEIYSSMRDGTDNQTANLPLPPGGETFIFAWSPLPAP